MHLYQLFIDLQSEASHINYIWQRIRFAESLWETELAFLRRDRAMSAIDKFRNKRSN